MVEKSLLDLAGSSPRLRTPDVLAVLDWIPTILVEPASKA